jgi:TRAP-type transport system periplasmic protein
MVVTRRGMLGAGLSGVAMLTMPAIARAQKTTQLRVAHATSNQSTYSKATRFFGARIAELTDSRITVREFAGGTLGSETTTIDLYGSGDIDIGFHLTSAMAPAVQKLAFLDSAFMFTSLEHWKRFAYSPEFRSIVDGYFSSSNKPYRIGMVGLGGARHVYTRERLLDSLQVFKGFKLRLPESPVAGRLWRALGTVPIAVPWPETYTAIETGLVEGAENTPNWYVDSRHIEVAKNFHSTNHLVGTIIALVGTGTRERIPSELREAFEQALAETSNDWLVQTIAADEKAVATTFAAANVRQIDMAPEVMAGIQKAAAPLAEEVAAEYGTKDLLSLIRKSA